MNKADNFTSLCRSVRFRLDKPSDLTGNIQPVSGDTSAFFKMNTLQITERSVPAVYRSFNRVREKLLLTDTPELYVVNDGIPNAYALRSSGNKRIIIFNSALLMLLNPNELDFVMGHELAHMEYSHSFPRLSTSPEVDSDGLSLANERFAELSADRVGLIAVRSLLTAAGVMIKMSSGLPSEMLGFDVDTFIRQSINDDPEENPLGMSDSHPTLPFRMWALMQFSLSDVYNRISEQSASGDPLTDVDDSIVEKLKHYDSSVMAQSAQMENAFMWGMLCLLAKEPIFDQGYRDSYLKQIGTEKGMRALCYLEENSLKDVQRKFKTAMRSSLIESEDTDGLFRRLDEMADQLRIDRLGTI